MPFRSGLPSTLIVSGFTIFQLMLAFTIVLGNFQQVCILMMIPLLPPWFWDRWTNGTTASRSISESISRQSPTKGARAVQAVVGVIAAYVFAMNAGQYVAEQIAPGHATLPGRPERIGSVLGLDQSWRLFLLPEIDRQFGWIVARGTLANGARIDLLSNRPESEWNVPPQFSPMRFFDWRDRVHLNSLTRFSPDDPRMKVVRPVRLFGLERSPPRVEPLTRARCHFHGGRAPAERGVEVSVRYACGAGADLTAPAPACQGRPTCEPFKSPTKVSRLTSVILCPRKPGNSAAVHRRRPRYPARIRGASMTNTKS